jgi:ferredoxin-NADP reductase
MKSVKTPAAREHTQEQTLLLRVSHKALCADDVLLVTLVAADEADLPAWQPGSHIDIAIADDMVRQYSLCGDVDDRRSWTIAVLKDPHSRGGSEWLHRSLEVGAFLEATGPRNNFPMDETDGPRLFIAGGIGITPLLPMIARSEAEGRQWKLLYGGRRRASMAFLEELSEFRDKIVEWPEDEKGLLPLEEYLANPVDRLQVYCCGPEPLLNAVEAVCSGWGPSTSCRLHVERFKPKTPTRPQVNTTFEVHFEYSDVEATVPANKSILEVALEAGIDLPSSCREGTCGTCETVVLEGVPDHRDSYLTDQERAEGELIMPCSSRSKTPRIVLDL